MLRRRTFLKSALGAAAAIASPGGRVRSAEPAAAERGVWLVGYLPGEDLFAYLDRTGGGFDATRYKQILGAANAFKEGDRIIGVAAANEASRSTARALLAATAVERIEAHPPHE